MTTQTAPAETGDARRGIAPFFAPLQREFDRVMADFSGIDFSDMFGATPRMDIRERDGAVEVTVELPGLSAKDVHIELEDDLLTISGEKKSQSETRDDGFRLVERRYGRFSRSARLPAGVKADQIKASLDQGVLTIIAPVDAKAGSRKAVAIPVKSA
jgi:HSP20 family protein